MLYGWTNAIVCNHHKKQLLYYNNTLRISKNSSKINETYTTKNMYWFSTTNLYLLSITVDLNPFNEQCLDRPGLRTIAKLCSRNRICCRLHATRCALHARARTRVDTLPPPKSRRRYGQCKQLHAYMYRLSRVARVCACAFVQCKQQDVSAVDDDDNDVANDDARTYQILADWLWHFDGR